MEVAAAEAALGSVKRGALEAAGRAAHALASAREEADAAHCVTSKLLSLRDAEHHASLDGLRTSFASEMEHQRLGLLLEQLHAQELLAKAAECERGLSEAVSRLQADLSAGMAENNALQAAVAAAERNTAAAESAFAAELRERLLSEQRAKLRGEELETVVAALAAASANAAAEAEATISTFGAELEARRRTPEGVRAETLELEVGKMRSELQESRELADILAQKLAQDESPAALEAASPRVLAQSPPGLRVDASILSKRVKELEDENAALALASAKKDQILAVSRKFIDQELKRALGGGGGGSVQP